MLDSSRADSRESLPEPNGMIIPSGTENHRHSLEGGLRYKEKRAVTIEFACFMCHVSLTHSSWHAMGSGEA